MVGRSRDRTSQSDDTLYEKAAEWFDEDGGFGEARYARPTLPP